MRRSRKALKQLGLRGLFAIVGGAASILGTACGAVPLYGAQPPYGVPAECEGDTSCQQTHGAGWYCDLARGVCEAPASDAGAGADGGGQ